MSQRSAYLILLFDGNDVSIISHRIGVGSDRILKDLLLLYNSQLGRLRLRHSDVSLD